MIYFNFNIRNPRWWDRFKNIKTWYGNTPFKHKVWEIEVLKIEHLFRIEFQFSVCQDHAGANLELALLGYQIGFTFYDERHWNTETGTWMKPGEEWGGSDE